MAEVQSLLARFTGRIGMFAGLLVLVGPLLAHLRVVAPMSGFLSFLLGGLLSLVAVICGVIAILRGGAGQLVWRGMIPGLLVIAIFFIQASRSAKHPRINDITTDTDSPPQFVAASTLEGNVGRDLQYPGQSFAQQQRTGYPDLEPLRLEVSPDAAFTRVRTAAHTMPDWEITREDANARVIEGVATSWLFHFKDDFIIEVRARDGGSVVQMRSKSRDGKGDVGANAARIKVFFESLRG